MQIEVIWRIIGIFAALIGIASSVGAPIIILYVLKNDLKWIKESTLKLETALFGARGVHETITNHEVRIVRLEDFRIGHDR